MPGSGMGAPELPRHRLLGSPWCLPWFPFPVCSPKKLIHEVWGALAAPNHPCWGELMQGGLRADTCVCVTEAAAVAEHHRTAGCC